MLYVAKLTFQNIIRGKINISKYHTWDNFMLKQFVFSITVQLSSTIHMFSLSQLPQCQHCSCAVISQFPSDLPCRPRKTENSPSSFDSQHFHPCWKFNFRSSLNLFSPLVNMTKTITCMLRNMTKGITCLVVIRQKVLPA